MRLTQLVLTGLLFILAPITGFSAGGAVSVRAIAFVASNERGATDPQLAPYQAILRSNLRFESFKYVGESSASVPAGGTTSVSAGGSSVQVESDPAGNIKVHHRGTVVPISRGRPAVFIGGEARGGVSGVIVMAN